MMPMSNLHRNATISSKKHRTDPPCSS
uniref:Uncharacterized protein n=1 Tax=Anguilla anguilla TaxID=7936 RepID=A0A0E9SVA0_ANGAN